MDLARVTERIGLHERANDTGELAQNGLGGVLDFLIVHSVDLADLVVVPAPLAGRGQCGTGASGSSSVPGQT
jgi:hypothetical protein